MKNRIIEFLKAEKKTSAQLAEEIGVQPSGISHILSGRNKPSLDFVIKMLERYKSLSSEWLLFGRGPMFREVTEPELFDQFFESENVIEDRDDTQLDLTSSSHSGSLGQRENENSVERIVWFFRNNSFRVFSPEDI